MSRRSTRLHCRLYFAVVFLFFSSAVPAQIVMLSQLPYRDPAALDALLSLSDARFAVAIQTNWPQTEKILSRYIRPGVKIDSPSGFYTYVSESCMSAHLLASCRLYMDFLSTLMKGKRAAPRSQQAPPVLLRPAQLPWKNTALLNAVLSLDASALDSALHVHWNWIRHIITHYLPDHYTLYPVSKVFNDVRATCLGTHTEVSCRLHLSDIDGVIDQNIGAPPTFFRTLAQLPYRDPAPLDQLLALSEPALRLQLSTNWPQINQLLNLYIHWDIALAGNIPFATSRLDCQAWMPADYFMCKNYLGNLSALMHSK